MKVLHSIMIPQLEGFGSGHYLNGLLDAAPPELENLVVAGANSHGENFFPVASLQEPLPWIRWGESLSQTMQWLAEYTRTLESVIESHHIDVINAHHTGFPMFPAALCKRKFGIPLVLTIHGSCFLEIEDPNPQYHRAKKVAELFQPLTEEADAVIVLSESQKEEVAKRFTHKHVSIVRPGIDRHFATRYTPPPVSTPPYFFYAGRLTSAKGVPDLIEVFSKLPHHLVLAGPIQDIDPAAFSHHNIEYKGTLPPDKLAQQYRGAMATIIPSAWQEPFGLVATESLSCGTPVIAYESGALKEIVTSDNGILCKNKLDLANAITKLADDGAQFDRQRIAKNAQRQYSWSAAAQQYLVTYKGLMPHA